MFRIIFFIGNLDGNRQLNSLDRLGNAFEFFRLPNARSCTTINPDGGHTKERRTG